MGISLGCTPVKVTPGETMGGGCCRAGLASHIVSVCVCSPYLVWVTCGDALAVWRSRVRGRCVCVGVGWTWSLG